jgi:hypothetical protein
MASPRTKEEMLLLRHIVLVLAVIAVMAALPSSEVFSRVRLALRVAVVTVVVMLGTLYYCRI